MAGKLIEQILWKGIRSERFDNKIVCFPSEPPSGGEARSESALRLIILWSSSSSFELWGERF